MNKPFPEQTVLVTGASGGIGCAIAERFAEVGMKIVIHYYHSHEAANEAARRCLKHGAEAMTVSADLRQRDQIERMKEKLQSRGFIPDILVNNASVSHYGPLSDVTDEIWDDVIGLDLKSVYMCSQLFMPDMITQKYGRIINVSSVWGIAGASCEVVYSAAKGGVNAFTKALAKELAPSKITVNAVAPGVVETPMMNGFSTEEKASIAQEIPAGRFASPEEVASLVYFLALPESGYITGQIISPNGGWLT